MFNKRNYNLRTLSAQQYHNLHQQSTNNWPNPLTNNAEYLQCGQIVIQMICQHIKKLLDAATLHAKPAIENKIPTIKFPVRFHPI